MIWLVQGTSTVCPIADAVAVLIGEKGGSVAPRIVEVHKMHSTDFNCFISVPLFQPNRLNYFHYMIIIIIPAINLHQQSKDDQLLYSFFWMSIEISVSFQTWKEDS